MFFSISGVVKVKDYLLFYVLDCCRPRALLRAYLNDQFFISFEIILKRVFSVCGRCRYVLSDNPFFGQLHLNANKACAEYASTALPAR